MLLALKMFRAACGAVAAILIGAGVAISINHEADAVSTYWLLYGGGGLLVLATALIWVAIHHRESQPARIRRSRFTSVAFGPLRITRSTNTRIEPTEDDDAT